MRFVSFFAGMGGFDLGLERAGHECVGQVEIDPYAIRVLEKHWPNVPRFGDIRTLDAATLPDAELWCGGFPCQPFSVAGKRGGTDDERDLWPAWFALVARRRPRWIFGENVPGLLSAEGGKAWGRVLRDLASVGYVAEWTVLSARDVGAPHRRERLWIVAEMADRDGGRLEERSKRDRIEPAGIKASRGDDACGCDSDVADADESEREARDAIACGDGPSEARDRWPAHAGSHLADAEGITEWAGLRSDGSTGERRGRLDDRRRPECWCGSGLPWCCDPADVGNSGGGDVEGVGAILQQESRFRRGDVSIEGASHGIGLARPTQSRLGRVAHGIPNRVHRLRCLGNAVVPQVVEAIARKVWG